MSSIHLDYRDQEDFIVNHSDQVRQFIRANYKRFSATQLCDMLGVSAGVIYECLTANQIKAMGKVGGASVIIVQDMKDYVDDEA